MFRRVRAPDVNADPRRGQGKIGRAATRLPAKEKVAALNRHYILLGSRFGTLPNVRLIELAPFVR